MADERTYFVLCADNCRFEGMTKEQILSAITQAVELGEIRDVDTGFVTKIKEKNGGMQVTLWVGTQAQYNAIEVPDVNCLYIITDDRTVQEMQDAIVSLQEKIERIEAGNAVIDISSSVQLNLITPSGAALQEINKKYLYCKSLGIVFYNINGAVNFTTDSTYFRIAHTGAYFNNSDAPASVDVYGVSGTAHAIYHESVLIVEWDSEIAGYTPFAISGWYFAKEGTT